MLKNAKAGSSEAVNTLFDRCAGRLLAIIRLRMGSGLRSNLESQDILQASLLKALQHISQFESSDTASLMAWLARIAENEIRDQARFFGRDRRDARRLVTGAVPDHVEQQVRSLTSKVVVDEAVQKLQPALEALDEHHREIIVLRKLEELSFHEIGLRLGKSPDACRMLLARALTSLTLKAKGMI